VKFSKIIWKFGLCFRNCIQNSILYCEKNEPTLHWPWQSHWASGSKWCQHGL